MVFRCLRQDNSTWAQNNSGDRGRIDMRGKTCALFTHMLKGLRHGANLINVVVGWVEQQFQKGCENLTMKDVVVATVHTHLYIFRATAFFHFC